LYEAGTPNAISTSGLLLAPDAGQAGGGLTWYDTSGNAANITLPASGVSWNVPTSSKTATGWTFGGDLTAVGTGTHSFGSVPSTGLATYSGNIRISSAGNGPATVNGIEFQNSETGSGYGYKIYTNNSNDYLGIAGRFNSATWTEFAVFKQNTGNLLLGTTTDSANGKLQLASHTTSAGGIGFGTDTSLFRTAAGQLVLNVATGNNYSSLYLSNNGTTKAFLSYGNSATSLYIGTNVANGLIEFSTAAAVTALTLDSSQNATFAKALTVNGPSNASATASLQFGSADNAVIATVNSMIFQVDSTGSVAGRTYEWKKGAAGYSGGTSLMTLDNSGNATFAGTVTAAGGSVLAGGYLRIYQGYTPSSSSETATAGTITWDTNYIYVATAANTWKRAALSTW